MVVENRDFSLSVTSEEVLVALVPTQEHLLPLSNLDLLLPPLDFGVFFCYKKPMSNKIIFGSMVGSLKKALAQALISYYVFAGKVVQNNMGEPEVLCNNRGVDFIEAMADVELKCLNFYNPDDTIESKFIPKKKNGILAIQATSLKCGGIVVACRFDHRMADAYSANMFLVSWVEMAQDTKPSNIIGTTSKPPCFYCSLLSPRYPGYIPHSLYHMYIPISKLTSPQTITSSLLSHIYYVPMEQLHNMQSLVAVTNSDSTKCTKLECFFAFLRKMIAHAASRGNNKKKNIVAKMGVVVDGRKRLCNGDIETKEMMGCYFDNMLSIPFGGKPVEELIEKPPGFVANVVHEFLEEATTKEHFLGLVDWVEAHRPVPGMTRIYCGDSDEGPAFVVSSGQRFLNEKLDFGWGEVMFASFHFPWGGEAGYVMPMPSPLCNGDWVVYMHLA